MRYKLAWEKHGVILTQGPFTFRSRIADGPYAGVIAYTEKDRGFGTECWIWRRALTGPDPNLPYGAYMERRGKKYIMHRAHRFAWEAKNGLVPIGLVLDHLCQKTLCVNPDHLEAVTSGENVRRGMGTTLTEDDVREIRARYSHGGVIQRELAEEYGISQSGVSRIVNGWRWAL